MQIRTSFSTLACPLWDWNQVIERGAAYGYDGVEIRLLQNEVDLLKVPALAHDQIVRRRVELRERHFAVRGLASSVRFDYPDEATRVAQVAIGQAYIDLTQALGGSFVRVFGDMLPPVTEPIDRETTIANIAAGLQQLGEYASASGIDVLIETHGNFADSRLMENLMQRVSSPRVGVLWDTHHPWRFFGEPITETWEILKPWVRHTHWKDSVQRPEREHDVESRTADERARQLMSGHRPADYVLFGGGEFPAAECLQVLIRGGYDGWFSLEWEKAWHPEIEVPEVALPLFPGKIKLLAGLAGA